MVVLGLGVVFGYLLSRSSSANKYSDYEKMAASIINKSEEDANKIRIAAKERISSIREKNSLNEAKVKERLNRVEAFLAVKEESLKKRADKIEKIKQAIEKESAQIELLKKEKSDIEKKFVIELAEKSGQNIGQVKAELLDALERDLALEREDKIRKYEDALNEEKERIAKNILTGVIQRYSSPTSVEKKATSITVPRDEIKGRLLGKNAENIKLFEELTGVDVVFNDAPNTIIISSFELVKKHVAREAMMKLMKERVITTEKVRLKIKEAEQETERNLIKVGNEVIKKLELEKRKFPAEFVKILGKLQFRTSYGQNILKHSMEVGNFTMMLGSELGLNTETCKIGGFFHDLGKAIDQEVGGSHDVLTKELMEKYGFSDEEIHAAWTHHDSIPQKTAESLLVKAGDAISATRPGARQESIEKYLERIKALEAISSSYEGVNKAFAISAGREVRVIVEPTQLKDGDLPHLAKNIATEIQENVAFPGKIKVNVIRRTQNSDYANKIPGPTKKQLKK